MTAARALLSTAICLLTGLPALSQTVPQNGSTLCSAQEETVFACSTGRKQVAVCASPGLQASGGLLQYRFGQPGAVELALPAASTAAPATAPGDAAWRDGVRAGTLAYSGGGGAYLAFANGAHRYVVFTAIGRGWGGKAGVVVERSGRRIAHLACRDEPASLLGPDFFGRAGIAPADGDFELP